MWQLSLSTVAHCQRKHSPATLCLPSQKQPPPIMMPTMITSYMRLGNSGGGFSPRVWSPCCRQPPAKARAVCPPACFRFPIRHPHTSQCIPTEAAPIPGMLIGCVGPAVNPTPEILVILVPGMESCSPAALTVGPGITRMAAVIRLGTQQLAAAQCILTCPAAQIAVGMMSHARQVVRCCTRARTCMQIIHQPWWTTESGRRARQWTSPSGLDYVLHVVLSVRVCLWWTFKSKRMLKSKLHCTNFARQGCKQMALLHAVVSTRWRTLQLFSVSFCVMRVQLSII